MTLMFGVAVTLGLVLTFPFKSLEQQLAEQRQPDALRTAYLRVWLAAEPGDLGIRLALAQQLALSGEFDQAREQLALVRQQSVPTQTGMQKNQLDIAWLELQILEQETYRHEPDTPERTAAQARLKDYVQRMLLLPWDNARLVELASKAASYGEPSAATRVYRQWLTQNVDLPATEWVKAASIALGASDYRLAAQLHLRARQKSLRPEQQREAFLNALRALQAGNLLNEALDVAEREIGALQNDTMTLEFLVRLALAANRPAIAERYARRMLQLALLEQTWRRWQNTEIATAPQWLYEAARQLPVTGQILPASVAGEPGLPFDDRLYELAYQTFLANRNLKDALIVARSAVRQAPQSLAWRERLAQVAEWAGEPKLALENWLIHARATQNPQSWAQVARLGPMLFDIEAQLAVLRYELRQDPKNFELIKRIVALYEFQGEPREAQIFLREQEKTVHRREVLFMQAELAERMGEFEPALTYYQRLDQEYGPTTLWALRIAALRYVRGELALAFDALERAKPVATEQDVIFWRNHAELARLLQKEATARESYAKLNQAGALLEGEYQNFIALTQDVAPMQAGELAAQAYQKLKKIDFALRALELWQRARGRTRIERFLHALTAPQLAQLEADANFLTARGTFYLEGEQLARAVADLSLALQLQPRLRVARVVYLWALIAARDTPRIERALLRWQRDAETDSALWAPYVAAYMTTNRQDIALRYLRKQTAERDDYLWQLAYAECLEHNSYHEAAWQVRRKVWWQWRQPGYLEKLPAEQVLPIRERSVALAMLFESADRARGSVIGLLRDPAYWPSSSNVAATSPTQTEISNLRSGPQYSAAAKEAALGWMLTNEEHDLARAWLLQRYVRQLAQPTWGQLSLALAENDLNDMERLLDTMPDWLPMYDRIEAAMRTNRRGQAYSFAFEQLDRLPNDEELHARLLRLFDEDDIYTGFTWEPLRLRPYAAERSLFESALRVSPRLSLRASYAQLQQRTTDATQLVAVPAQDRMTTLALHWRQGTEAEREWRAQIHERRGTQTTTGLSLRMEQTLMPRVRATVMLGWRQPADETVYLRAGGMKDELQASLFYTLAQREYASFTWQMNRLKAQSGLNLARGSVLTLEFGHRLRLEYPDLNVRFIISQSRYSHNDALDPRLAEMVPEELAQSVYVPDIISPSGATRYGVVLSFGDTVVDRYTRAWRPFGSMGWFSSRSRGTARTPGGESTSETQWQLGATGSVLGADKLQIEVGGATAAGGTSGSAGTGSRWNARLHYRWLY